MYKTNKRWELMLFWIDLNTAKVKSPWRKLYYELRKKLFLIEKGLFFKDLQKSDYNKKVNFLTWQLWLLNLYKKEHYKKLKRKYYKAFILLKKKHGKHI